VVEGEREDFLEDEVRRREWDLIQGSYELSLMTRTETWTYRRGGRGG
jgi:hypothetical protein